MLLRNKWVMGSTLNHKGRPAWTFGEAEPPGNFGVYDQELYRKNSSRTKGKAGSRGSGLTSELSEEAKSDSILPVP